VHTVHFPSHLLIHFSDRAEVKSIGSKDSCQPGMCAAHVEQTDQPQCSAALAITGQGLVLLLSLTAGLCSAFGLDLSSSGDSQRAYKYVTIGAGGAFGNAGTRRTGSNIRYIHSPASTLFGLLLATVSASFWLGRMSPPFVLVSLIISVPLCSSWWVCGGVGSHKYSFTIYTAITGLQWGVASPAVTMPGSHPAHPMYTIGLSLLLRFRIRFA
jgi:hypothetical protein